MGDRANILGIPHYTFNMGRIWGRAHLGDRSNIFSVIGHFATFLMYVV
jgi:hypothetical protein